MGSTTNGLQMAAPVIFLVTILLSSNFIAGQIISSNTSNPGRQSDDTVRVDPLDHFKKYRGGFDITNKHYWSSTVFTGVSGYVIGILWLLGGIIYGVYLLVTAYCSKSRKFGKLKKRSPCHKQCYLWPILLAIIFTILAITASGLVLGGNAKFHSQANTVIDIIIDTADDASETVFNTTGALKDIRNDLESVNASTEASNFLTSTSDDLDSSATDIQRQARKNRRLIDRGIKIVYIITTVIISLNLVAVITLSVCGTLRFKRVLKTLIVLCWILTALCWFFFGVNFFLSKFANDACTAFETFQQDPYNNSLSSILPCDDLRSAKSVISDVSRGIYELVDKVNANISSSGFPMSVCNPFSGPPDYQYQPNCSANTFPIRDIPEILSNFICSDNVTSQCVSDTQYRTAEALTASIETLLNVYPGMESLVECQIVKDAFSEILSKHCKPLKKYVHMVWASMLFLSLVMVFLVIIWVIQTRHEQEHHYLDGSVKPDSAASAEEAKFAETKVPKDGPKQSQV